MKDRYIVDTNVLIAASAGHPSNPKDIDATPQDPLLRRTIWEWLSRFTDSDSRMVLDEGLKIQNEYQNKLSHNDFGLQVLIHKWSNAQVDNVPIDYDDDENACIPRTLETVVHDLADRKMVASALACDYLYGEGCVAFAGDTDWHEWEAELLRHRVLLEPIIEAWSRAKYLEKLQRK